MTDQQDSGVPVKQISVKVPLAVWQWYRMRAIVEGSSLQSVCSRGLVEWMDQVSLGDDPVAAEHLRLATEAERLRLADRPEERAGIKAHIEAHRELAGAFSPAASGSAAGAPGPLGVTCQAMVGQAGGGWKMCGAVVDPDGACPVHGSPPGTQAHIVDPPDLGDEAGMADPDEPELAETLTGLAATMALEHTDEVLRMAASTTTAAVGENPADARATALAELAARKKAAATKPPKRATQPKRDVEPRLKP